LRAAGFDPTGPGFRTGCVRANIRRSGTDAFVTFTFRADSACIRYAFNGSSGLRLTNGAWKQIFVGSDLPPCSLGLPPDLTACQPRVASAGRTALAYQGAVLKGDIGTACSFLSAQGVAALRKHLQETTRAGCSGVMRIWAGEPNHGLPDSLAKLHVAPVTLGLREQAARWLVDAPLG
jgi:hypothetical protein